MAEILREALPDATISTSSGVLPELFEHERFSTTVANAVLSPLVSGYVQRARAAPEGRRLRGRPADPALRRRRDDARGGPGARGAARRVGHRGGRRRRPLHRRAVRTRERHRRRHGRHEHRHLARLRRHAAHDQRVVRRVRAPDLLPVDRGADDRRGRRLAGEDRRRRLAAQRPAVGRLATPGRRPTARAARSRPTPTPTSSSDGSASELVGGGMSLDREAAEEAIRDARRRAARPRAARGGRARSSPSPTPTWPTRCGSSRCSAATTRASSRSSSSAAPGRCTAPRWRRSWACPTVLVPPRPGTWSALGCLMVDIRHDLSEMFLRPAADADAGELDEAFERLEDEGPRAARLRGRRRGRRDARALDRDALPRPVALARGRASTATSTRPVERFHAEHEREFSYRRDDAPVELYRLQLVATGTTEEVKLPEHEPTGARAARADRDARRSTSTARRSTRPSTRARTCRPACASKARR